jgi:hypothetical protein
LNKLDDPKATQKDKAVDVAKSVAAIAGLIPNPVIGPATKSIFILNKSFHRMSLYLNCQTCLYFNSMSR